ncbi:MAG: hypothetical protein QOG21_2579 [Actinomycetota bacterium]|jgi:hypothetical protein|nr:hypothetical protein [Actinomycetota bacterium]
MTDDSTAGMQDNAAEQALVEVEKRATADDEDHAGRLDALERLHGELEAELDERDSEPRPGH